MSNQSFNIPSHFLVWLLVICQFLLTCIAALRFHHCFAAREDYSGQGRGHDLTRDTVNIRCLRCSHCSCVTEAVGRPCQFAGSVIQSTNFITLETHPHQLNRNLVTVVGEISGSAGNLPSPCMDVHNLLYRICGTDCLTLSAVRYIIVCILLPFFSLSSSVSAHSSCCPSVSLVLCVNDYIKREMGRLVWFCVDCGDVDCPLTEMACSSASGNE